MTKQAVEKTNRFLASLGRPIFLSIFHLSLIIGSLTIILLRLLRRIFYLPKILTSKPLLRFPRPRTKTVIISLAIISLAAFIYTEIFYQLPNPKNLSQFPSKLTTQIYDRNGVLLYKIFKDENRTLISLNSLPKHTRDAFLSAEDRDFYNHGGFSLMGLSRAIYRNLVDHKMEGGSTITQQLVKNTILTSEKTLTRKIREIILAVWAEQIFSKDEIFEMYLNQVGFGGPAYGIQEAARQYFDIDATNLSLAQSAYLAGITKAPSKYSPFGEQPELAAERQVQILQKMQRDGFISTSDLQAALSEKLDFQSAETSIKAPHFVMLVKKILIDQIGENTMTQGGLKVYTTLDINLQDQVQKIITDEIKKLQPLNVNNGAALVTNPQNGEVLAMVGSKDYFNLKDNGQVNLTTSLRQPGSSIKPINYALYFEKGHNPAETIDDHAIAIRVPGQPIWTPKNYDNKFHGRISLRQALASSYNIPSVLLLTQNGLDNFAQFAHKLGITTWNDPQRYGYSMALGSLEVKMTDLATAYSAFANEGTVSPLHTIIRIEKPDGSLLHISGCINNQQAITSAANAETDFCRPKPAISATTAYLITDILSDNSARSPAFGSNSILNIKNHKVAVKTGTSNNLKDNWAIGFTSTHLVATWVGNNDGSPMSRIASGITGASPIWSKIFKQLININHQSQPSTAPNGLVKVAICTLTGTLPCTGCPTRFDYFVAGTEPRTACDPTEIQKRLHPSPSVITPTPTPQIL